MSAHPVLFCVTLTLWSGTGSAQSPASVDTAALQRLLVAEDARGTGAIGLGPLLTALTGTDTLLRRLSVRGLGRLQRPELGRVLLPFLSDTLPAIRAEAANAIAQSMRGVRRGTTTSDTARLTTREAAAALTHRLSTETEARVVDALGQSLGRLPLADSAAARDAENAIRARLQTQATPGLVHGMYTLARVRRTTGNLTPASALLLRRAAISAPDTTVRRLALLTLAVAAGLDSATAMHAIRDRDDEARRMVLRGSGSLSPPLRRILIRRAQADSSTIVRLETVAAARLGDTPPDCAPILSATRDREPYVVLTAI
ncbi:MAG: HEAT repeat domain-containing protein, partial [Gemmatimonadales bacterium]